MSTTDHAAEAQQHINGVHDWQETEGSTDATHLATALLAQVHATLALAEEQRATNRTLERIADEARTANLLAAVSHDPGGFVALGPKIIARLGLDGGEPR